MTKLDRTTGELLRSVRQSENRYQHRTPGSLLHVDVKKLGRVPDGGGWRVHGREVTDPTQHRGLGAVRGRSCCALDVPLGRG